MSTYLLLSVEDVGLEFYLPTGVRRVPPSLTYAKVGLDVALPTGVRTFRPRLSFQPTCTCRASHVPNSRSDGITNQILWLYPSHALME